jgi:hypothetical protein
MTPELARRKANLLRKKIESLSNESIELFYHAEPFDVACDIAERRLSVKRHLHLYLQIRDEKHGFTHLEQRQIESHPSWT